MTVDIDGDSRADYSVSGADRDGDGVPDTIQVHGTCEWPPRNNVL